MSGPAGNDVAELAKLLKQVAPKARKLLPKRLRAAGEIVRRRAAANASWSRRIPGAIALRSVTSGAKAGVLLRINAAKAPHARAYEGMQRGTNRRFFRHRVYGNDTWVSQPTRPFLVPALIASRDEVDDELAYVVDDLAGMAGFRRR